VGVEGSWEPPIIRFIFAWIEKPIRRDTLLIV